MAKAILVLVLFFNFAAQAEYLIGSVPISVRNETQSFFDIEALAEIANQAKQSPDQETIARLSDFFTSTSIHFESNGRYTTLKNGFYSNAYIAPAAYSQKNPIFEIELKASPEFIRAYALFMGLKMQDLMKLAGSVHSQIQNTRSAYMQIEFNNFYTCLRAISISPYGEMPQFPCLPATVRSLGLKNERTAIELANTYMVLYRASRLSFQSSVTIDVEDPFLKQACKTFQQTIFDIQMKKSSMMNIPQPSFWAQMSGPTSEWDNAVAYYIATPRLTEFLGPYVTALDLPDKDYLDTDYAQRRICLF
jgi:hypothetical protein